MKDPILRLLNDTYQALVKNPDMSDQELMDEHVRWLKEHREELVEVLHKHLASKGVFATWPMYEGCEDW